MDKRKYFFVGMRFYCLEKMLDLGLDIVCIATKRNSFVEKEIINRNLKCTIIENKKELLELIRNTQFDILVSNGCPYILPISELRKADEKYINIHPSLLPDLRGINPINGAILFDRPQGATCHYMDDGIDTGDIISQVKVDDNVKDIPLDLLYQLSFMAESQAFLDAYNRDFKSLEIQNKNLEGTIYYSRKSEDQLLTCNDSIEDILKKVNAFKVEGQYARIIRNNIEYIVKDAILINAELLRRYDVDDNEIITVYKNNVVIKKQNHYLLLRLNSVEKLTNGDKLILPLFK